MGSWHLYLLCVFFGLGSFLWGYNIGIIATIFVSPGFIAALSKPSPSQLGFITAIYYLGTWISYIFLSGFVNDRLGRRYAALTGTLVTCIGAALEAGAQGSGAFAMMIAGRIISGFGNAIISTSVPLYQSEISPAAQRGSLVVLNHIGLVAGLSAAFWVGYGMSQWTEGKGFGLSWRLSIAVQFIPAALFLIGLPFAPETPRWLLEKGRIEDAQKSLEYLRGQEQNSQSILDELAQIKDNIDFHKSIPDRSWSVLFTNRNLFARLWRVALLQFMAQTCGATAIKYYLPTIFLSLGLSQNLSLLASGIESSLKVGCTMIEMLIIDKAGRKITLILGTVIMAVSLMINGALPMAYPGNINRASDYTCVIFIFFFSFGYSIGFGPNSWVYGTEIFPTYIRAKGLNISASGGAIGSIIAAQAWPVAIQHIGSKTYLVFMTINIVSIALLSAFYPETKGRTLEQIDELFEQLVSHSESVKRRNSPTEGPAEIDAVVDVDAVPLVS